MIYKIFQFSLLLSFAALTLNSTEKPEQEKSIAVYTFEELQPLLQKQNDTLYIVNFWATWCAPCIAEIPYFEKLGEKYSDKKVKVLMVSLDFPTQVKSRLIPFIEKEKMKNEVVLLDDPNSNAWIPLVDKDWSGAIPATLIYNESERLFFQQEFSFEELDSIVSPFILKE